MSRRKRKSNTNHGRTDREKLELFLNTTEELSKTTLAQKGFGFEYTQQWSRVDGIVHTELEQPDENDFRSFLLTFRKFVSQESDVNLH